ncbi:MAG: hypothetical protein AAFQ43_01860 [Bacteroidota bacterium]
MRFLPLVAFLVLAGCSAATDVLPTLPGAPATPSGPTIDVSGTYDTTWGTMTLRQDAEGNLTGSYSGEEGAIEGTVSGNVLTGYWIEPQANNTCSSTRNGSPHWGRIEFTFPSRQSFEGGYTDCANPMYNGGRFMGSEWVGTRTN